MGVAAPKSTPSSARLEPAAVLRARGIGKSYQLGEENLAILKSVDLTLRPGEFVAIEGRSGSGKSTLLHILGGLDSPTQGTLEFNGAEYTSRPSGLLQTPILRWVRAYRPINRMLVYVAVITIAFIGFAYFSRELVDQLVSSHRFGAGADPMRFYYSFTTFMAMISAMIIASTIYLGWEGRLLLFMVLWLLPDAALYSYLGPPHCYLVVIACAAFIDVFWLFGALSIHIAERPICRLRNEEFGFVFQFYHLLPELNVLENTLLSPLVEDPSAGHPFWKVAVYRIALFILETLCAGFLLALGVLLARVWFESAFWMLGLVALFLPILRRLVTVGWRNMRKKNDLRSRATTLLESLGLGHRLRHKPNQLSGGERQRVAIARALMNNPKVLFADEPTGNLDYETGRQIMAVLEKLHRDKNQTIVMVTHDRSLASQADRVLVLRDGKLEKPGETSGGRQSGDSRLSLT